jgi:teichuronic acid biosynthesis glycosyltransferase TuaG
MPGDSVPADVSVVIPAYNAADTIERALSSIARQSLLPRQVIVVDDGSTDGTFDVAREAGRALAGINVQVVRQANAGAGAARNRAVEMADGAYLAFLDADDEWLPEKLQRSLTIMDEAGVMLTAHNGWIISNESETYLDIAARFKEYPTGLFHGLYRKGFISTSSVVVRRDAVTGAGGFDETLLAGQDFDLWLKVLGADGSAFTVFNDPLTRYHIRPNSITSNTETRLRCTLEIAWRHVSLLKKYPGSPAASLFYRLTALHKEAVISHLSRGRYFLAARTLILYAVRAVIMPFRLMAKNA